MQRDGGQAAVPMDGWQPRTSVIQSPCQDSPLSRPRALAVSPGSRQEQEDQRKRRRGGWPKGRKRRPARDPPVPRAPSTGYVLFLHEQRTQLRAQHPDLPFPKITKLLAAQWAQLSREQKQKYMYEADEDKQRYIRELQVYQSSAALRMRAHQEPAPCAGAPGSQPAGDGLGLSTEEGPEGGLHCRTCRQNFRSRHNKREHLLGRPHLHNLAGEFEKDSAEFSQHPKPGEGGGQAQAGWEGDAEVPHPLLLPTLMPESFASFDLCFLQEFISKLLKNKDDELRALRASLEKARDEQEALQARLGQLQNRRQSLELELVGLRAYGLVLEKELESLYRARGLSQLGLQATFTA